MKPDINKIIDKLLSYAYDNLLLDTLDETYTLNKLAAACGVTAPVRHEEVECGDVTLEALIAELTAAAPNADISAVLDAVFPLPRTINYYFADRIERDPKKAFDFLYELCGYGYKKLSKSKAFGKDGFLAYSLDCDEVVHAVTLPALDGAVYAPRVLGNHIAEVENRETHLSERLARLFAYVNAYGGAIACRDGSPDDYLACDAIALSDAKVKTVISDGAAKVDLLDYPVPALAVYGIARNTVAREAVRIVKAARAAQVAPVIAAAKVKDGVKLYIVFAGNIAESGYLKAGNALTACGVFRTVDCSPILSVLEKGTALSTDLAPFKAIYDKIGGVKHGAKALAALGGALTDMFRPALAAAASASEADAIGFATPEQQ